MAICMERNIFLKSGVMILSTDSTTVRVILMITKTIITRLIVNWNRSSGLIWEKSILFTAKNCTSFFKIRIFFYGKMQNCFLVEDYNTILCKQNSLHEWPPVIFRLFYIFFFWILFLRFVRVIFPALSHLYRILLIDHQLQKISMRLQNTNFQYW